MNNSNGTLTSPKVNIIMRNAEGKIVYGAYTRIQSDIAPKSSGAFEHTVFNAPEHVSVEAYLMTNGIQN